MRYLYPLLVFALFLPILIVLTSTARPAGEPPPASAAEIDRLIKQLGSPVFSERAAAAKKLKALGTAALTALEHARTSGDADTQRLAQEIIATIERQSASAKALAPTKVHLRAKATPLADVVGDLVRQSKIPLSLDREPTALGARPVTLDTGETSFWEALDALCRQAKIHLQAEAFALAPDADQKTANALRQACQLVLQDGVLPETPVAYLGSFRVRLLRDPFRDAKKMPRNDLWTVEVLSEPKLQWQESFILSLEEPRDSKGEKVGAAPVVLDKDPHKANEAASDGLPLQPIPGGGIGVVLPPDFLNPFGSDVLKHQWTVIRQEYPVTWTLPAAVANKPVTLPGKLQGVALLPPIVAVTVKELLKAEGKPIKGKDGSGLTVNKLICKADGTVEMRIDVEPALQLGRKNSGIVIQGLNAHGMHRPVAGKSVGLYVWDTQGRPYAITATVISATEKVTRYRLVLKSPAKNSVPGKLERYAAYRAEVNQTFTIPDVLCSR